MTNAAFSRSKGIVDPVKMKPVNIIGCGSIGSFAAVAMAKAGFKKFVLYDDDIVGEENIGPQMFGWKHLNMLKTEALRDIITELSPTQADDIVCISERVHGTTKLKPFGTIVAVDNMATRKLVWTLTKNRVPLLIDGRIGGQEIHVYSVRSRDYQHQVAYESTLYSDAEAVELPCTERNVAYVGLFVGAMVAKAATAFYMRNHVTQEMALDARNFYSYNSGMESESV